MTRTAPAHAFAVGYGELESLLARLGDTQGDAIRTRFRKLRLRPFPDDIQTGTGVRVRYDLPRLLAIIATFELNGLLFPQGQSVLMVERAWPEFCRASIAAAVEIGLIVRPSSMPRDAGPFVTLLPDAFATGPAAEVVAAAAGPGGSPPAGLPLVIIDARRFVVALASDPENAPVGLADAFAVLELAFGWTPPTLPTGVTRLKDFRRGHSFLERGPFFERAVALVSAPVEAFDPARPHSVVRLQALLDYLLDPAPVDAWKGLVGDLREDGRSGLTLTHLLSGFGESRGLRPSVTFPGTLLATAEGELANIALDHVRRASAQ